MGDIASRKHSLHERWDGKNSVHYFYPFIHSFIQSITHSLVLQLFLLLPLSLVPPMLSSIAIYMKSTPRKIIVHPDNVHSFVHLISISKLLDSHSNCDDDTRSYKIHKTFQMKQQPQQQTTIQRCTTPKMVLEQRVDSCASTWQWHWTHWCLLWIVFGTDFFFGMQFDLRRKFWFMCLDQNVHASKWKSQEKVCVAVFEFLSMCVGCFFSSFSSVLPFGVWHTPVMQIRWTWKWPTAAAALFATALAWNVYPIRSYSMCMLTYVREVASRKKGMRFSDRMASAFILQMLKRFIKESNWFGSKQNHKKLSNQ